jgi:hypothetical protein
MTLPRTVAEVLSEHVLFEIECIDRMYLNVYQPRLQYGGGVSAFFVGHRGHKYASSVLMQPITDAFVANIHHYIAVHDLDLLHFGKGENKTTSPTATWPRPPTSTARTGRASCSSGAPRRRRRCSAHRSAATR